MLLLPRSRSGPVLVYWGALRIRTAEGRVRCRGRHWMVAGYAVRRGRRMF